MAYRFEIVNSGRIDWIAAQQASVSKGGSLAVLDTTQKYEAALKALEAYRNSGGEDYRLLKPESVVHFTSKLNLLGSTLTDILYRANLYSLLTSIMDDENKVGGRVVESNPRYGLYKSTNPLGSYRNFVNSGYDPVKTFFDSTYPEQGLEITKAQYDAIWAWKFQYVSPQGRVVDLDIQKYVSKDRTTIRSYPSVWVGLTGKGVDGGWKWINGDPLEGGTSNTQWADDSNLHEGSKTEPTTTGGYGLVLGSDRSQPGKLADDDGDLSGTTDGEYGYLIEYEIDADEVDPDSPYHFDSGDEGSGENTAFDKIPTEILGSDIISHEDSKDYGISLGDTFDIWRKKTNGLANHVMGSFGPYAYAILQRVETARSGFSGQTYNPWSISTDPTQKRNIKSVVFTGSDKITIQFEKPREHNNHVVLFTVGRTSGGQPKSLFDSHGVYGISGQELCGVWLDNFTKNGFSMGSNIATSVSTNRDHSWWTSGWTSVFSSTNPNAYYDKISLVIF